MLAFVLSCFSGDSDLVWLLLCFPPTRFPFCSPCRRGPDSLEFSDHLSMYPTNKWKLLKGVCL